LHVDQYFFRFEMDSLTRLFCGDVGWGEEDEAGDEQRLLELIAQQEQQARLVYLAALASAVALLISLGLVVLRWRLGTVQARRFVLRDANRRLVAQLTAGHDGGELELRDARGEICAVLGDGLRLRDQGGRSASLCAWARIVHPFWSFTTSAARYGLVFH
jgi:hypothetical protein